MVKYECRAQQQPADDDLFCSHVAVRKCRTNQPPNHPLAFSHCTQYSHIRIRHRTQGADTLNAHTNIYAIRIIPSHMHIVYVSCQHTLLICLMSCSFTLRVVFLREHHRPGLEQWRNDEGVWWVDIVARASAKLQMSLPFVCLRGGERGGRRRRVEGENKSSISSFAYKRVGLSGYMCEAFWRKIFLGRHSVGFSYRL